MFVWSYIAAVWTQPGYARDARSPAPPPPQSAHSHADHVLRPQFVPETDPPQTEEHYDDVVAGQPFEQQQDDREFRHLRRGRRDSVADEDEDEADDGDESTSARGESALDEVEMRERRRRSLAPSAPEEDRLAEQCGGTAALGPDIASAILNGTRPPTLPAEDEAAAPKGEPASRATDERERCQSTASTTVAPSSARSALTFPPKAHLPSRPTSPTAHHTASPPAATASDPPPRPSRSSAAPSYLAFPDPPDDYEPPKRLPVERIPRNAPVLTEQYRYNAREGIVRPYRSHRCRHCAAVVLSAWAAPLTIAPSR